MELKKILRSIPDFPKKGIIFKDVMPILGNNQAFKQAVDGIADLFADCQIDKVCAAEARGFIFAAALAYKIGCGMVPIRKPGKLPWKTISYNYDLEYGQATLQIHEDALKKNEKVLLIDDLLATGGTAEAMVKLVEQLGAEVVALGFVVELDFLKGRDLLKNYRVQSLIHIEDGE